MVYMIKFFMEGHLVFKASTASYQYGNTCITLQCLHCITLIASLYLKKKNTKLIKQKIHIFLAVDPTSMSLGIP